MKRIALAFCAALFSVLSCADEAPPAPAPSIVPVKDAGMVWNKWETPNFVVLSIDFSFGERVKNLAERKMSTVLDDLGIGPRRMPVKCKIVCVRDREMLSKFFGIDAPRCESRRDASGSVSEISVWMDQASEGELAGLIASACLHDRSEFIRLGVAGLMRSPSEVSGIIRSASEPSLLFLAGGPATVQESVAFCLFLRREFGIGIFSEVLDGDPPALACGFDDLASMRRSFGRYLENLKSDLESGRTPPGYLRIGRK